MKQHTELLVCILVVVGGAACVLAHLFILSALDTAKLLHKAAEVLRAIDPRVTLIGRLRGALAALWWLGPLRPSPVRDPLEECGVRLGVPQPWWEALWKYAENNRQLACLRERVTLPEGEHRQPGSSLEDILIACLAAALILPVSCWLYAAAKSRVVGGDARSAPVVSTTDGMGASTAAAGIHVWESASGCMTWQRASAMPPLEVPLSPEVSFTVTLDDWAMPAWFKPEHRQLLHILVLREGRGWKERFLSGKKDAAYLEMRLRDTVQTFLTHWGQNVPSV